MASFYSILTNFIKKMKLKSIVVVLLITITNFNLTISQSSDFGIYRCRNNTRNFLTKDFKQTIIRSLNSLTGNVASHGGFYNSTASTSGTRVTSTALCRGDIGPNECETCVKSAIPSLLRNCPNHAEAAAWYSDCIVRFSEGEIVGVLDMWTSGELYNSATVDENEVTEFSEALSELTVKLTALAANGGSVRKLGFGNVTVVGSGLVRIFAMMQCSPDLSKEMCRKCLMNTSEEIGKCCSGRVAARVFYPNCFLRYSNEHFYNDPPLISTSGEANSGKKSNTTRTLYVVVPVICGSLGLIVIGILLYLMKKRRNDSMSEKTTSFSSLLDEQKQTSMKDAAGMEIATVKNLQYELKTIEVATNSFSPKNTIGKGGFGLVYKGVLNGQEVAVKRLSETSGQGVQEFINEAVLVAKLQHRNLVRLLGFCHESKEKILIYEYVPNKSLDCFLFKSVKDGHLDWATRWKIIGGITRGMLYLHEDSRLRIIHRDLKASNILLDQDMNAKISDFGLSRIFGVDQTLGNTSKIAGTLGYMSPEYAMHGHFSVKSDVFSFGVIVLEIVSGRRNSSFYQQDDVEDLLPLAWKHWTGRRPLELLDPTLTEYYSKNEVVRCINIGLLCVQEDADARPSMASILNMLNNNSITLPEPKKPPYFLSKGLFLDISGDADKSYVTINSEDESSTSKMYPR